MQLSFISPVTRPPNPGDWRHEYTMGSGVFVFFSQRLLGRETDSACLGSVHHSTKPRGTTLLTSRNGIQQPWVAPPLLPQHEVDHETQHESGVRTDPEPGPVPALEPALMESGAKHESDAAPTTRLIVSIDVNYRSTCKIDPTPGRSAREINPLPPAMT